MGKFVDLTGQKFGRLTVIKRMGIDNWGTVKWLCKCNCELGTEVIVVGSSLRKGHTKSCGCLNIEQIKSLKYINKKYNTYDLSGEFGIGYTSKGEEFYFDLEDYDLIKNYSWRKDNYGYIVTSLDKKLIKMHRLVTNCPEDMEVDHEFHDEWDNRKEFLRIVTKSQNQWNRVLQHNSTSGITGISWNKKLEKWEAYIVINNNKNHLGYFITKDEAIKTREQAEIEYFGEYRYKKI